MNPGIKRVLTLLTAVLGIYLAVQYLLPLILPFLLGTILALASEPVVRPLCHKLRCPRPLAAGIGVFLVFSLLTLILTVLCALAIRQLRILAGVLPDLENTVRSGMDSLSAWLMSLAQKAPGGLSRLLTNNITEFFSGGAALLDRLMGYLFSFATGVLSRVPDSALLLGTGIISSFMISAKLPKLQSFLRRKVPQSRLQPILETLSRLKTALGGWLKAQFKLCGVTFLVTAGGLFLLRVKFSLLWALLICLVDAFPILGAGTALIPWSLVSFLQGDRILAFGLLGIYATATVTRSVLEPRLLGQQFGLDPLAILVALYAGYRLWGFGGMILSPLLAVTVTQILKTEA